MPVHPARFRLFAFAGLMACSAAWAGEPLRFEIDPVHTRVLFLIDHAGYSKAMGTVSGSEGSLQFDPEDWSQARLDVMVPMNRIDMGDANWTAAMFTPRWLEVKRYPQARFVADRLTRSEGNRGTACGQLTLHGVTRPLCLQLTLNKLARFPLPPFKQRIGFSASGTLKRSDFGITGWKSLVGEDVDLRIEAELIRVGDDDEAKSRDGTGQR